MQCAALQLSNVGTQQHSKPNSSYPGLFQLKVNHLKEFLRYILQS